MILVTGGTGLVGAHLLYSLINSGESIRAIHRKSSDLAAVKNVFSFYTNEPSTLFDKIEWMEADITDVPSLSRAFKGIDYVYHAAAYISFNPKHYSVLKKVNIEGTANIVNFCLSEGIKKMCYSCNHVLSPVIFIIMCKFILVVFIVVEIIGSNKYRVAMSKS